MTTDFNKVLGKPSVWNTVSLFVPSTQNFRFGDEKIVSPIPPFVRDRFISIVEQSLSERFGGATREEVQGSWVDSDTRALVYEDVSKVFTMTGDLSSDDLIFFRNIALACKSAFGQDAVLLTINGKGWFI